MNSFPGIPFPGHQDGFASRDEVVDYLKHYAAELDPPVRFRQNVSRITQNGSGFHIETEQDNYSAANVVVATGPFHEPKTPGFASKFQRFQLHSDHYRSERDLPEGSVLVVGSGNSGVQIAVDLSKDRKVWLSRERDYSLPRRLTGEKFQALLEKLNITDRKVSPDRHNTEADLMWWMQDLGLYDMPRESPLGQALADGVDPYIGKAIPAIADENGIVLQPKLVDMNEDEAIFDDETEVKPDIVIWATGYRYNYAWANDLPAFKVDGAPLHQDGITDVPGFYFLGLRWMRHADSGLLKGVGSDAAYLAEMIGDRMHKI
jgi:putative flavoprotein involved in K+ transport